MIVLSEHYLDREHAKCHKLRAKIFKIYPHVYNFHADQADEHVIRYYVCGAGDPKVLAFNEVKQHFGLSLYLQ